jgi:hypothetical protein
MMATMSQLELPCGATQPRAGASGTGNGISLFRRSQGISLKTSSFIAVILPRANIIVKRGTVAFFPSSWLQDVI